MNDKELYNHCLELSLQIHYFRNKFIALLPEVNKRKLFLKHGMHSIYEFGAKLAGLSNETVKRVLKLSESLQDKPILRKMFKEARVGWSKLEVAAKIVTPENEAEISSKLLTISKSALETLVKDTREVEAPLKIILESFPVKLSRKTMNRLRVFKLNCEKRAKRPLSWGHCLNMMLDKCENLPKKKIATTSKLKIKTRYIPTAIKTEVMARTNQMCGHSNCFKPAQVLHHEIPFAVSKNHESLIPLCKDHHDIVHHSDSSFVNKRYQMFKLKAVST